MKYMETEKGMKFSDLAGMILIALAITSFVYLYSKNAHGAVKNLEENYTTVCPLQGQCYPVKK